MDKQTQDYIILKPIAERFNRIASEITDDDIRNIIKQSMREQLEKVDFSYELKLVVDKYFENETHKNNIIDALSDSIIRRLK